MRKLLILCVSIALISCDSDDGGSSGPSTPSPTAEYYITSTMDGSNVMYEDDDTYEITLSLDANIGSEGCTFNYGSFLSNASQNYLPSYGITFKNWIQTLPGQCTDDDTFAPSFEVGPVNFSFGTMKGVVITYQTSEGQTYTTAAGTQDNNLFEVTAIEIVEPTTFSDVSAKIKGTFSCTLYNNTNPTDLKVITNGTFSLPFESNDY